MKANTTCPRIIPRWIFPALRFRGDERRKGFLWPAVLLTAARHQRSPVGFGAWREGSDHEAWNHRLAARNRSGWLRAVTHIDPIVFAPMGLPGCVRHGSDGPRGRSNSAPHSRQYAELHRSPSQGSVPCAGLVPAGPPTDARPCRRWAQAGGLRMWLVPSSERIGPPGKPEHCWPVEGIHSAAGKGFCLWRKAQLGTENGVVPEHDQRIACRNSEGDGDRGRLLLQAEVDEVDSSGRDR